MLPFTSTLSIYSVHLRPTDAGRPDRIRFVREGFNGTAFVFSFFWALYHQLWRTAGLLCLLNLAIALLADSIQLDAVGLAFWQLGLNVWFGFHANDALRAALKRRGYLMTALISGENQMRAEQRFFDRHAHFLA